MKTTIEGAIENLNMDSPRKIRKFLESQGIKGDPGSPDSCPVANYIKENAEVPKGVFTFISISVNPMSTFVPPTRTTSSRRIYHNDALRAFIRDFDSHSWISRFRNRRLR